MRSRGRHNIAQGGLGCRDLEAIGDAVTGGVLARAVEPGAGERARRPHA